LDPTAPGEEHVIQEMKVKHVVRPADAALMQKIAHLAFVPDPSSPTHEPIQQTLRTDPHHAIALIEEALSEWPGDEELLRLRAEGRARVGEFSEAWADYRAAASVAGVILRPLPESRCPVCEESDATLCWVGESTPTSVLAWVRCTDCRTARRVVPPSEAVASKARRDSLGAAPDPAQLQQELLQVDGLIERLRDSDYGLQWLDRAGGSGRASMLVVGSRFGALLAGAEWRGFEAQGIEPDTTAAEWAQDALGVVVWESLQDVPPTPHDVIVIEDGLGESTDPAELLQAVSRRLVTGGLLAASVPCLDHPAHRSLGYDDPRWSAPEAAVWFDRAGVSLAMLRAGMQPISAHHHPQRPGEVVIIARRD
jgi:SAM-dependent methyltransferase